MSDASLPGAMMLVTVLACVSPAAEADEGDLQKAVTFYASFDDEVKGDAGKGNLSLNTRFNHETEKGKFVVEKGFDSKAFRIARNKGIAGGALEATDVLPRNGRVFFPAKGNIAFRKGGWGGSLSVWINTDPDTLLKTKFCDPIQITEKGANNGGIWFDFNDAKPRDMRMGTFPAVAEGQKPIAESDPKAPMVRVPKVGFKSGDWHHIVLTWKNFDTGKPNAHSALYIDGKLIGEQKDYEVAMSWDVEKAGIYTAINYIGLLDELALFDRPLTAAEIEQLRKEPGYFSTLKKAEAPAAPKFPFAAADARRYQQDFAAARRLPVEWTNELGMVFVLTPSGTFLMGSPTDEPGHNSGGYDETQHPVTLTQPFYLSKHETTVAQFRRYVEATKYVTDGEKNDGGHAHDALAVWIHRPGTSWRKPGYAGPFELKDDQPVVHVSQHDSKQFCRWLQVRSRPPEGFIYDLPTEAQWEWACRAGSGARFSWGPDEDTTGKVVNAGDQSLKRTHPDWPRVVMPMNDGNAFPAPVGSYQPNAFGLHDMLGNVWEFCATRYGPYPRGPVTDPQDGDPKRGFAVRGGGWSNIPSDVRCASRNADPPHFCHSNLGFRVALVAAKS